MRLTKAQRLRGGQLALAGLGLILLMMLMLPREQMAPLMASALRESPELDVKRVEYVGRLGALVAERALPSLAALEIEHEFQRESAALIAWLEEHSDETATSTLLYALSPEQVSTSQVVLATVDWSREEVKQVLRTRPVPRSYLVGLMNIQHFYDDIDDTPFKSVNADALRKALDHPDSLATLTGAIERSERRKYSEVGGLLMLRYDQSGDQYIAIEYVPGRDEVFAEKLLGLSSDLNAAIELMEASPERFDFLESQYRVVLRELKKPFSVEQRTQRLRQFLDLYGFMSKMTYEPSQPHLMLSLSRGIAGDYVAGIHVHPLDNEPSLADKMVSLSQRLLVLVPREKGFDIFDLYPGLENFDQPERVSYRSPDYEHPSK